MCYFSHLSLIALSVLFIFGSGCKRAYYNLMKLDSATPLVYEVEIDTSNIKTFGGIDYGYIRGQFEGEKVDIFRVYYTSTSTKKHSIFNLQLSAYAGRYLVSGLGPYSGGNFTAINYDGYKWAYGATASFKSGINFNFSDFRLGIGLEPMFILEFGDYYSFRIDAAEQGVISNEDGFANLLVNVFPYLSYYFDKNKLIAFQISLGLPGGISPVLSYQSGSNIFWIGYIPTTIRFNVGYMKDFNSIKSQF